MTEAMTLADQFLDDAGIGARANVIVTFIDGAGVMRAKVVPSSRLERVAQTGLGASETFAVFTADDSIARTATLGGPTGDMRLVADLRSLTRFPDEAWAWVGAYQCNQDLDPLPTCQRAALDRQVAALASDGRSVLMAFELEFTLFAQGEDPRNPDPLHDGPAFGIHPLLAAAPFIDELIHSLADAGIPVEQFHSESAPGQYEISTPATDPLTAVDRLVAMRAIVRWVADKHHLQASFSPMPVHGEQGSGCHTHFSVWEGEENVTSLTLPEERRVGAAFAAGILEDLPGLAAVFTPSVVSYQRMQPSKFAGSFACWGPENREAALRYIEGSKPLRPNAANFELKAVDGSANPYLVAAVLIGAGRRGIERGARLPGPVVDDPGRMSDDERARLDIRPMPESLPDALALADEAGVISSILGPELAEAALAVRRFEAERFAPHDERAVVERMRFVHG